MIASKLGLVPNRYQLNQLLLVTNVKANFYFQKQLGAYNQSPLFLLL